MRALLLGASFAAPIGCTAELDGEMQPSENGGSGSAPNTDTPVDLDDLTAVDPETLPDGVPSASRVLRLSYDDYDRTVSDLLGIPVDASDLFPAEAPNLGPYEAPGERLVTERFLAELALSAEELASQLTADATAYQNLVECSPSDPGCRDAFLANFGLRAYRRPLTAEETSRLQALFDSGAELIASGDGFRDGVQLVVEAVLQSAKFLYRVEAGADASDEAGELLTGYEIASRLSYLFWGTMPDAELLAAAESGELSTEEGIVAQAERLAESSRLSDRVLDFHRRWIQLEGLAAAEKDPQLYPEFGPELLASMRAEVERFVEETTVANDGAILELLTSNVTYVDDRLAELYGLPGTFSSELVPASLPADSGRLGLLTQAAFLTGHSSASTRTSPILRGVFLMDRILCEDIPPPPPGAAMEEPSEMPSFEIQTTRQYFEWKTSMPACASCHTRINPAGFAFEAFDGIGRPRPTENGAAVDPTGTLVVGENTLTIASADDLISQLATLPRVRSCYAKNWLEFAYGRETTASDQRTLGRAARDLETPGGGIRTLLVELTRGAAFNHLPPIDN